MTRSEPQRLDLGFRDAVGVDATLDDVDHALHGRVLLIVRDLAHVGLQRQLRAALQVEAELGALTRERAEVDARVAWQRVAARDVVAWLLRPDHEAGHQRQQQNEKQALHR